MSAEHDAVRVYFDRTADDFDRLYAPPTPWAALRDRLLRPSVYRRTAMAQELCRAMGGPDVLDVGCGTARTALALCDAGARSVLAVDFAPVMIERARAIVAATPHAARIELGCADAFAWTPPRRVPLVTALGVVEYFADPRPILARLAAFSSDTVAFSVRRWTPLRAPVRALRYRLAGCPIHFATRHTLERACAASGLRDLTIRDGGAGSYWAVAHVAP
jgi:SAM-dependent methyltransferase